MRLSKLFSNYYFLSGLFLKLILIVFIVPAIHSEWFIPFFQAQARHFSFDPWSNFLVAGGDPRAFPYGIVMYLFLLPGFALGKLLSMLWPQAGFINAGIGLLVFAFDLALMFLLKEITQVKGEKIVLYYWLSPIVIYICYWHGQLDIVPVTLLVATLWALKSGYPKSAGCLLAASISAKLSMALAVPVLAIFLWRNNRLRFLLVPFLSMALIVFGVIQSPYFYSPGFVQMVFGNPEFNKLTLLALNFNQQIKVYILPVFYALFIYGLWRLARMSYDLLYALLGIGFFLMLIFTPASVGWYLWIVPFVVIYQVKCASKMENYLIIGFSCLFVLGSLLYQSGAAIKGVDNELFARAMEQYNFLLRNYEPWWITFINMLLSVLCVNMYLKGIRNNDYFRLSRKPLTIGIAGDSGAGKDTLSGSLAGLFNANAVTSISGDDYHKWDRYSPMWKVLTHLDPRANKLQQFQRDILAILGGKSILARHYDHSTGRFTKSLSFSKNDVILISGLHVLYLPQLRDKLDIKIYLEMDEALRRFFKLKRDVMERGHTEQKVTDSIEKRMPDAEAYLYPQKDYADIIFSLEPAKSELLADYTKDIKIPLRLRAIIRKAFYYEELARLLIGLFGMWVDTNLSSDGSQVELLIDGEISAEDVAMVARTLVPPMDELLDFTPLWREGVDGIMQLIVLLHTAEVLHARLM